MLGYKEKEISWKRKEVHTERQLYRLIKKAARKLGWDPQTVESLVQLYGHTYDSPEIGWQVDWFEDGVVFIYIYSREKERL